MRSVLACVLCLIASASALLAAPRVPMQQQQLAARVAAPQMANKAVERVVIEVEQGEPCVPCPCLRATTHARAAREKIAARALTLWLLPASPPPRLNARSR